MHALFKPLTGAQGRVYVGVVLAVLAWLGAALPAQAQVFKLPCDVEGKVPALDDLKLPPTKITVELQTIGKHLYFNVVGARPYDMRVSSLVTEAYLGTNLTSSSRLGARRKNRDTQKETEIVIDKTNLELTAHNDTDYQGKPVRVVYAGKCKMGG